MIVLMFNSFLELHPRPPRVGVGLGSHPAAKHRWIAVAASTWLKLTSAPTREKPTLPPLRLSRMAHPDCIRCAPSDHNQALTSGRADPTACAGPRQ